MDEQPELLELGREPDQFVGAVVRVLMVGTDMLNLTPHRLAAPLHDTIMPQRGGF